MTVVLCVGAPSTDRRGGPSGIREMSVRLCQYWKKQYWEAHAQADVREIRRAPASRARSGPSEVKQACLRTPPSLEVYAEVELVDEYLDLRRERMLPVRTDPELIGQRQARARIEAGTLAHSHAVHEAQLVGTLALHAT